MKPAVLCSPPSEIVNWMNEALGLSWTQIADYFDASTRTVQRWRAGEVEPSEKHAQRLDEIDELRWWVTRVFQDDPALGRQWLATRQTGFGGKAPLHLIVQGHTRRVIAVLAADETGTFS